MVLGIKRPPKTGVYRRFFANARPAWDLRYFSKLAAFWGQLKAIAVSILQGRYFEVWWTWLLLWAFSLGSRSLVIPV